MTTFEDILNDIAMGLLAKKANVSSKFVDEEIEAQVLKALEVEIPRYMTIIEKNIRNFTKRVIINMKEADNPQELQDMNDDEVDRYLIGEYKDGI